MPLVSKAFGDIITFTRASTGTYFDATGTLQSAAIDAPRLDYNPATLAAQGLLIEEARTNLCLQSADFATTWTPTNTTVTTNAVVSPDSTTNADNIFETTTNGEHYVRQSFTGLTANTVYTITVFVKDLGGRNMRIRVLDTDNVANGYQITVSPSLGTIVQAAAAIGAGSSVTGTISTINNGWYRVTLSGNAGATCTKYLLDFFSLTGTTSSFAGDITKGVTLYGAQLEAGAFPTSYIPTTTTALTRSADVASVNTLSPWYNQTEGTIYAELQSLSPLTSVQSVALGKYPPLWFIEAGASDSNVSWYGVGAEMFISGTYNNIGTVPSGINKFAVSLAASGGQSRSSLNGAAAVNRSGTLSGTATQFFLGRDFGGTQQLNGWLRRITYYPRALSAAELQAITA